MSQPNQKLFVISLIAIVLGVFGLFTFLSGIANIATSNLAQRIAFPAPDQQTAEVQRHMTAELMAERDHWRPYQILLLAAGLPASIGLLLGGNKTRTGRIDGLKILKMTFLYLIPFDIARTVFAIIMSQRI